MYSIDLLVVTL